MTELLPMALKTALVIFMAGNLLDMGLRLDPKDALRGLRDARFVACTLVSGFALGPALAYAIALVARLEHPYATGLILLGMAPCAPFLPMIVAGAKVGLGHTAAFMLLTAVGTVVFMPLAVPLMVAGLTVSAWAIAKPLLAVMLLPLIVGMAVRHASRAHASRVEPFVKQATTLAMIATVVLCAIIYGKELLGLPGSLALATQLVFFLALAAATYGIGFGLPRDQKIVLSVGMATRNLGAALATLFSVAEIDQRAIVMVMLGLPVMVVFALLAVRRFGRPASPDRPA